MKITETQNMQSKFLISRSLFLGGGVSLILSAGQKDAWIGIILGFFIGICIIYLYTKLSNSIEGSLHNYLRKKTPLNILIRLCLLAHHLFLIFLLIMIFSTFIYSYYLPFTKAIISCAPFLFLAVFLSNKGIQGIAKVAQILFFLGISLILLKSLTIFFYMDFQNFLPIYTNSKTNIFLSAIYFATLTTTPYLLMIEEKCSFKTNIKAYTLTFISIIVMISYIIGCFGTNLIQTFSYPEFTILRMINFFNFIQNIESFLALNWLFDIFIAFAYASLKIKNLCNYKKNYISYLIIFIMLFIVGNFIISDYIRTITIYKTYIIVFFILTMVILLLLGIKKGFQSKSNVKYK